MEQRLAVADALATESMVDKLDRDQLPAHRVDGMFVVMRDVLPWVFDEEGFGDLVRSASVDDLAASPILRTRAALDRSRARLAASAEGPPPFRPDATDLTSLVRAPKPDRLKRARDATVSLPLPFHAAMLVPPSTELAAAVPGSDAPVLPARARRNVLATTGIPVRPGAGNEADMAMAEAAAMFAGVLLRRASVYATLSLPGVSNAIAALQTSPGTASNNDVGEAPSDFVNPQESAPFRSSRLAAHLRAKARAARDAAATLSLAAAATIIDQADASEGGGPATQLLLKRVGKAPTLSRLLTDAMIANAPSLRASVAPEAAGSGGDERPTIVVEGDGVRVDAKHVAAASTVEKLRRKAHRAE